MRADRLISLVLLLQTRGKTTAAALAEELDVSRRTILRDIEALSMAGVPVYAEGGHGGGIALDEGYRTSLTGLKEAEIRSLFVAGNAALLRDIGLGDAAESSLLKLTAALPAMHQRAVEHIRQRVYIDPLWWWHESAPLPFWDALQTAVYEDRRIRVTYENHGKEFTERVLEPYSLVAKSSTWYLVARRESEMRTYRVSRLHEVALLDERFERDSGYDLAAYWQAHLAEFAAGIDTYEFILRIDPARLNFVRWLTPGRSELLAEDAATGWLTVRINVEAPELADMLVFGLGAQAEVIEPETLRERVRQAALALIDRM
jgi:predicted DNA-binding transcriptional regulator YafY